MKKFFETLLKKFLGVGVSVKTTLFGFLINFLIFLLVNGVIGLVGYFITRRLNVTSYILEKLEISGIDPIVISVTGLAGFLIECFRGQEIFTAIISLTTAIYVKKNLMSKYMFGLQKTS